MEYEIKFRPAYSEYIQTVYIYAETIEEAKQTLISRLGWAEIFKIKPITY